MKTLKPAFKIYKKGMTTDGPVTILKGDGFNETRKREFYTWLGYTITDI